MNLKEIKIGEGLGLLKFGMSKDQVIEALGQPDETDKFTDEDEDTLESWEYYDLELSVSFSEEDDWRLCIMSTMSEEVTFKGDTIIGLNLEEVKQLLKKNGINDFEVEDFNDEETPNLKLLSSDDAELNFWIDTDIVTEVQWGPLFEDEDTIIWPK